MNGPAKTCTDCGETKPLEAFVQIKAERPGVVYGRCRACRNARARARYHSTPEIRAKEVARALRNWKRREAAQRTATT